MDIFTEATSGNEPVMIPYIAHESMSARMERTIRRLWIMCIMLAVMLLVTNGAWVWHESQFEGITMTEEVSQDSGNGGVNNFTGGDVYGTTEN